MRSPQEFLIGALRLLGAKPDNPNAFLSNLAALGQPLWGPPGPNGFSDLEAPWASPEGMKTRLDVAARRGLDGALAAFEDGLRARWADTALLVVTEFGRTARVNGTTGTDHGTATVAFLAGGAIRGGRVIADWPGLRPAHLHEGRDLKPTTGLRAVAKGVLGDLFGVSAAALGRDVFPQSGTIAPLKGLVI